MDIVASVGRKRSSLCTTSLDLLLSFWVASVSYRLLDLGKLPAFPHPIDGIMEDAVTEDHLGEVRIKRARAAGLLCRFQTQPS